jgi:hypothetical protein
MLQSPGPSSYKSSRVRSQVGTVCTYVSTPALCITICIIYIIAFAIPHHEVSPFSHNSLELGSLVVSPVDLQIR